MEGENHLSTTLTVNVPCNGKRFRHQSRIDRPLNSPVGLLRTKPNYRSPFSMKQRIIENVKSMQESPLASSSRALHRFDSERCRGTAKTLDLLRHLLQDTINKEIDTLIKRYVELYFIPAITNIRQNIGDNAVQVDHLHGVCQQILEEAKKLYPLQNGLSSGSPHSAFMMGTADASASCFGSTAFHTSPSTLEPSLKMTCEPEDQRVSNLAALRNVSVEQNGCVYFNESEDASRLKAYLCRISPDTLFVIGSEANRAMGRGHRRGLLYSKHPELFKYSADGEDRNWLADNDIPSNSKSCARAYILFFDDIHNLMTSQYGAGPSELEKLSPFKVPDFMLQKIRTALYSYYPDACNLTCDGNGQLNNSQLM